MPSLLNRLRARIAGDLVTDLREQVATMEADRGELARNYAEVVTRLRAGVATLSAERDTLRAKLDALAPKPRPVVREDRRTHVLAAIGHFTSAYHHEPTALDIAACMRNVAGYDYPSATIARWVSDVAAEGWIIARPVKPMTYRVSDSGRVALAGGERVVA